MTGRVAFVTWDGPAQDYLASLFFPIFAGLVARGWDLRVWQFSFAPPERIAETRERARRLGIGYEAFPVRRRPRLVGVPATLAAAAPQIAARVRSEGIDVLMPRAILPAGIVQLAEPWMARAGSAPRIVFDADGLMADERVDFAGWRPEAPPYRVLRAIEARALRRADAVITRTRRAAEILAERDGTPGARAKIHVIPNPSDAERFRPAGALERTTTRASIGAGPDTLVLAHVGSLGTQYAPETTMALARAVRARRPDTRLLLLTGQIDVATRLLAPGDESWVHVDRVAPEEVGRLLAAADIGLAIRRASFSQQAVCPIKVGEYLLSGLPVVGSPGIGDVDEVLGEPGVGWMLRPDDADALVTCAEALATWKPSARIRSRCRARGLAYFSLPDGILRYDELLRSVCARPVGTP